MDLATLLAQLRENGQFAELANNPLTQFGTASRPYLGATLLPERAVDANIYEEFGIRWRTVIANAGSRYSPAQKKSSGLLMGKFLVQLADSDIAAEFTAREYDALLEQLNNNASMDAMTTMLRWLESSIVRPLAELNERDRWTAMVDSIVERRGDNAYAEDVLYANPAGHRVNAGTVWSDNAADPLEDIYTMTQVLRDKGYICNRIITSRSVVTAALNNPNVRTAAGAARLQIDSTAALTARYGRPSLAELNAVLAEDDIPTLEIYDQQYQDYDGYHYFLKRGAMVFVATTGQDATIVEDEENIRLLPNVLGYTAIGTAVGEATPGRVVRTWAYDNKPPRVVAEGWQTSLPVITDPEAIAVLSNILT